MIAPPGSPESAREAVEQPNFYLSRITAGLRYECDAISLAIGEGCGECLGCVGYAAAHSLASEFAAALAGMERLTAAAEARIDLYHVPPERPSDREAWEAVIREHVNATVAARLALAALAPPKDAR